MNKTILTAALAFGMAAISPFSWAGLESGIDAYNGGDYAMALHELRPLAEKANNSEAQKYLGIMYANGQGVTQDETLAAVWFTNAAIGGNADAQIRLGDMYQFGKGVGNDSLVGAYWHWRAANGMAAAAKTNLEKDLKQSSGALGLPGASGSAHESGCTAPVFHADAAHFGENGTLDLAFLLDPSGKAINVDIFETSAWPVLDKLARDAFTGCSFLAPAHNGKAAPGVIKASFSWKTK